MDLLRKPKPVELHGWHRSTLVIITKKCEKTTTSSASQGISPTHKKFRSRNKFGTRKLWEALTKGAACMFDPDLADYVIVPETEDSGATTTGFKCVRI